MSDFETDEIISDYVPKIFDIQRHFENYTERGKKKFVVGNDETRLVASLIFPIRKTSVVIKGTSGSGKSTIVKSLASLIWGEDVLDQKVKEVLYIADSSDKGILTDTLANRIANVCTHCVVPELQNAIRNERVEAIIKLWTEGESYPYTRGDHGGRISREIILRPLPIITSIATENKYTEQLGEEMERRFFPFYTIANKELNKQIHKAKSNARSKCDEDIPSMSNDERVSLRFHLQDAMVYEHPVKNPCADYMKDAIPSNYVISNSMIDYWFDLVEAIATFYFPLRLNYSKSGGKDYLMATPEDNYLAWKLGGSAIVMASMNIPDMGREIINILPIRDNLNLDAKKSVNEIIDELQHLGIERTKKQVVQILRNLESVNYARRDEYGKDEYYKTQDYNFDTSVDWSKCLEETKKIVKENQPEIAKEYIHRYCSDPRFFDPITGKKIKLLDIPYEKKPLDLKKIIDIDKFF